MDQISKAVRSMKTTMCMIGANHTQQKITNFMRSADVFGAYEVIASHEITSIEYTDENALRNLVLSVLSAQHEDLPIVCYAMLFCGVPNASWLVPGLSKFGDGKRYTMVNSILAKMQLPELVPLAYPAAQGLQWTLTPEAFIAPQVPSYKNRSVVS